MYSLIVGNGLEQDSFFMSHLIRMFDSFHLLLEADRVFSKLSKPSIFAWTAIISAYAKFGESRQVIKLYCEMQNASIEPDCHVSVTVLKACAMSEALTDGQQTHACVLQHGLEGDVFVCSALINMYSKCGKLFQAHLTFEKTVKHSLVTWNSLIAGYVQHGHGQEALCLFFKMQDGGLEPDKITFLSVVKACTRIFALEKGEQIHAHIIKCGLDLTLSVGNSLIDMYAKCGNLEDACLLFDRLPQQDVVSWSAMIAGYAQHGFGHEALQLFRNMQQEGIMPNLVTFICVVNACSKVAAFEQGKKVHAYLSECGFEIDLSLGSALVHMYAKCGSLRDAGAVFNPLLLKNSVIWNALIGGYAEHGHGEEAFQLFQQMQQQGVVPDQVTFACILKACTTEEQCKRVHSLIIDGIELETYTGNILMDSYAKFGSLENAKFVFSRLPEKNVVTWSTLIAGFVQHGLGQEAFGLLQQMQQEGVEPNHVTFLSMLKACSNMAALDHGKAIHATIVESGVKFNANVASALIDMYAKCGSLDDVHILFDRLPVQDDVVWSTLIGGHAHHSDYEGASKYFKAMLQAGLKPDGITFLCLLSACSHAGMLDEGCLHFKFMSEVYGIPPNLEHYDCLVDLFSFSGRLSMAEDLLETIPYDCNVIGWKSLLSACRRHGNVPVGRRCFEKVVKCEPENASGFTLMSTTYSYTGLREEAENLEEARRCAKAWKKPAKAFIEIDNQVHSFTVGDTTHPSNESIHSKVKSLTTRLLDEGYLPQYDLVLSATSADDKQGALCGHSEKLAIAFGLINTPQSVTLRVSKNFRMCNDCHSATKLISRLERRDIVISDTYCVHQFKNGACSCRD